MKANSGSLSTDKNDLSSQGSSISDLKTEQETLRSNVNANEKALSTHELNIENLENKQVEIIKRDKAQELKDNNALKKKVDSLKSVQLSNSKDIVSNLKNVDSNQAKILHQESANMKLLNDEQDNIADLKSM